jgi:hypothetical protein
MEADLNQSKPTSRVPGAGLLAGVKAFQFKNTSAGRSNLSLTFYAKSQLSICVQQMLAVGDQFVRLVEYSACG